MTVPWWQRLRPCKALPTYGGRTAEQWAEIVAQKDVEIANLQGSIQALQHDRDSRALHVEKLLDLLRDVRKLTEREGV